MSGTPGFPPKILVLFVRAPFAAQNSERKFQKESKEIAFLVLLKTKLEKNYYSLFGVGPISEMYARNTLNPTKEIWDL